MEFRSEKVVPPSKASPYERLPENLDDTIIQRIDEELKRKFNGKSLDDYLKEIEERNRANGEDQ